MQSKGALISFIFVGLFSNSLLANTDWPSFLGGSQRNKTEFKIPLKWSKNQNIVWNTKLTGYGQSSPVVFGDRIYLTSVEGPNKEKNGVLCHDLKTGKQLWVYQFENCERVKNNKWTSRAAPTVAADKDGVYAFFESGDTVALNREGQVIWKRSLTKDYSPYKGQFGLGASVAQWKNQIFILADNDGPSYLLSIDKQSGKTNWKKERKSRISWSSPMIMNIHGKPQIVVSSTGTVDGYDLQGNLLWQLEGLGGNNVSSPIKFGENSFLVAAAPKRNNSNIGLVKKSNLAVKILKEDEKFIPKVLWRNEKARGSYSSPIVHKNKAYFISERGILCCVDVATGDLIYQKRMRQTACATPIGQGDRIFFFGERGTTTVISSEDEYIELAVNNIWKPSPEGIGGFNDPVQYGVALVDDGLLIRTGTEMYLVSEKKKKEGKSREKKSKKENWSQWRGPSGTGNAIGSKPPSKWNEKENVKWKVPVPGKGTSTPIVHEDRIYLTTAIPLETSPPQQSSGRRRWGSIQPTKQEFKIFCFDRNSGKKVWEKKVLTATPHEGHHQTASYANASITTDGKSLFVSFGSRGIYCYDLQGNQLWKRDFGKMKIRASFGEGGSPTLHQGTLIIPWDHEGQSFIYAIDAKTGQNKWQKKRDEPTTWSSPVIAEFEGTTQVILHGHQRIRSYDLKDGKTIWECGGQAFNPVATPVVKDGIVYCTTGRRGYVTTAIPLSAKGDITGSDTILWNRKDFGSYVPSPVVNKDYLYNIKGCDPIISCFDRQTGETIYGPQRLPGMRSIYASLVAADDRIYVTDRDGTTIVLQHDDELNILATNRLDDGTDASLAIAENEIFLRTKKHLYCIGEKN